MRRLAAAACLLALSACKVERTPREFYMERDPGVVEQQEAAGEIRGRVRSFAESLGRGDRADAVEALAPVDLAQVIGADVNSGLTRLGPAGLRSALDSMTFPAPAAARMPDLTVQVGLREGMGWFSSHVELLPAGPQPPLRLRVTGVFTRDRGEWRMAQIHLSRAWAPPAPDSARADSADADTAAADSAD